MQGSNLAMSWLSHTLASRLADEYPGYYLSLQLSLTPDGRAITTTRHTVRSDLWTIAGLPR